jgi:hypothetical protein
VRFSAVFLGIALVSAAAPSRAQPAPGDDARKAAAKAFVEGEKAFAAKDYALAASRFEEANRLAPHPNAVWNEARALQRAGERAHAANLYAKFLREAPSDARDLADATKALDDLSHKLARVDVTAAGFDTVLMDDVRVEAPSVYVEPGRHVLEGRKGEQVARSDVTGEAGSVVTATLTLPEAPAPVRVPATATAPVPVPAPASASAPAPATAPAPAPSPSPTPEHPSQGWSPAVVYVSSAVTAVLLGVTIWSGVDTLSYKNNVYAQDPNGTNYDDGKRRQNRTNFFLAFTLVGAAFTAGAAIWLVDWHGAGGSHAALGVGVGSVALRGELP